MSSGMEQTLVPTGMSVLSLHLHIQNCYLQSQPCSNHGIFSVWVTGSHIRDTSSAWYSSAVSPHELVPGTVVAQVPGHAEAARSR